MLEKEGKLAICGDGNSGEIPMKPGAPPKPPPLDVFSIE